MHGSRYSHDGTQWSHATMLLPEYDGAGRPQLGGYSAVQGLPHGEVGVVLQAQRPPRYHLSILFTKVAIPSSLFDRS
jgi:hypothetical protein